MSDFDKLKSAVDRLLHTPFYSFLIKKGFGLISAFHSFFLDSFFSFSQKVVRCHFHYMLHNVSLVKLL